MDWIRLFLLWIILVMTGCVSYQTLNISEPEPILIAEQMQDQKQENHVSRYTSPNSEVTNPTLATPTIWEQFKSKQNFHVPMNNRIAKEQSIYLASPVDLYRLIERSEPYIYWIVEQLKQRELPIELALLPMIESGFNPAAISSAKAAGLWQFIPLTATEYGLNFNRWYDPRRNLFESTEAALNLLEYLNKQFDGDWLLALAAYNAGEGRVKRAIQFNTTQKLSTHFWALNLPEETMNYVPRLLALVNILSKSKEFQLQLPQLNQQNQLHPIDVPIQLSLSKVSELANLSLQQVRTYNAGHLLHRTNPSKGSSTILLPKKNIKTFSLNLKKHFSVNTSDSDLLLTHQVSRINLDKNDVTREVYSKIDDNIVRHYQKIHTKNKTALYRIQKGDSLYAIAHRYKVKLKDLLQWNKIANKDKIKPGMTLTIYLANH